MIDLGLSSKGGHLPDSFNNVGRCPPCVYTGVYLFTFSFMIFYFSLCSKNCRMLS